MSLDDARVVACELCRNESGQVYWVTKPDLPDMPLGKYVHLSLLAEAEATIREQCSQISALEMCAQAQQVDNDALQSRLDAVVGQLNDMADKWCWDAEQARKRATRKNSRGDYTEANIELASAQDAEAYAHELRAALGCATTGEMK